MKVAKLTGAPLDYWVARALGWAECPYDDDLWKVSELRNEFKSAWKPSADWAQGGPIIEREKISIELDPCTSKWEASCASFYRAGIFEIGSGDSPLVAAMRAYVASKYGDAVPDEVEA